MFIQSTIQFRNYNGNSVGPRFSCDPNTADGKKVPIYKNGIPYKSRFTFTAIVPNSKSDFVHFRFFVPGMYFSASSEWTLIPQVSVAELTSKIDSFSMSVEKVSRKKFPIE